MKKQNEIITIFIEAIVKEQTLAELTKKMNYDSQSFVHDYCCGVLQEIRDKIDLSRYDDLEEILK